MNRLAILGLFASACGRISFDPIGTSSGSPADARRDGAAGTGDGASDGSPDPCSVAIALTPGVRSAQSTCQGRDVIDACGPTGTEEVVFAFAPPTTKSYQIAAYDPGNNNVSNSTVRATAGCAGVTGACSAITGTTLSAGTTYYFVVEASSGGCANIEFLVQ